MYIMLNRLSGTIRSPDTEVPYLLATLGLNRFFCLAIRYDQSFSK